MAIGTRAILSTLCFFLALAYPASSEEPPSIAVLNFTSTVPTRIADQFPELLSNVLINSGKFSVLERSKLHAVMAEQNLGVSGLVDPNTAVTLGNLIGAQFLVVGNVNDFSSQEMRFSGYGVHNVTTIYRTNISVKILETKTGRALYSTVKSAEEKMMQGSGLRARDGSIEIKLSQAVAEKIREEVEQSKIFDVKAAPVEGIRRVRVDILSDPPRADVELDDVFYGNAGRQMELPAGLHRIRISLAGYEPWIKKVNIQPGLTIKPKLIKKK